MVIGVTPRELERDRSLVIIDIRAESERTSELGFIPASLLLPMPNDPRTFAEQVAHITSDGPIVLACVSGRRSGDAVRALEPLLGPTLHLEGGLLGWGAAGMPLCCRGRCQSGAPTGAFHQLFRSSLLAELVEVSVETDTDVDAIAYWRFAYESAGMPVPEGANVYFADHRMWPVIDRAAAMLRLLGTPSERIVRFSEPLYAEVA